MNEDNLQSSGHQEPDASGELQENEESRKREDVVAYDTHRKLLSEKKKTQAQLEELKKQLGQYEQQKLEAEGRKDEVIKSLRQQLSEKESILKEKDSRYAWNVVSGQIKSRATQEGCKSPDKLLRLLDKEDLSALEVDDNYMVNQDDLSRIIEKAKRENDFLFSARKANVNDLPPSGKVEQPEKKTVKDLSRKEKFALLGQMLGSKS